LKYQDKTIVFADLLAQQDIFRSVCDGLWHETFTIMPEKTKFLQMLPIIITTYF
jgi:hypothetical protein